jgi:WD40-like Beta Propeller Repeat
MLLPSSLAIDKITIKGENMKFVKYSLILAFLFILSACNSSPSLPAANPEESKTAQTPEIISSPTPSFTATPAPTPTLILQSQYGRIQYVAGDRLIFNNNMNPGTLTITNKDLSDPVSLGVGLPGYKFLQSVSPDGKWVVFFTNSVQSQETCDKNNVYVANLSGTILQNLDVTICPFWADFRDVSWDAANLKYAFPCKDTQDDSSGICMLTIAGDKIDWSRIAEDTGQFATSPDQKRLVYDKSDYEKNCIYTTDFDTQQSTKRYCNGSGLMFLNWLSDSQTVVGIGSHSSPTNENQLLLFDFNTKDPKELLTFTGEDDSYLALSPDRSQIAFCASQKEGTPPVLYMYDFATSTSYKIENTALIYTDDTTCNNGQFTWTDKNALLFQTNYKRDKTHSYLLDFVDGSISE